MSIPSANGPPKGVEPSELFAKLTSIPRPQKTIDYPRKDPATGLAVGQLILVPLTEGELMACRAAAERYAIEMLAGGDKTQSRPGNDSLGYRDIYVNAVYVEFLVRACRAVNAPEIAGSAFGSSALIRQWLTSDEIAVLFEACEIWQAESGPIVSRMTEAEMEAWIELLAEGASRVPLAALSSQAKIDLLLFMAARLRSYSTGKSSPGSVPGASATVVDGEGPPPAPVLDT